ncbi:caM kinase-like vesicle-associated, like [Synchiropus splendidus]|uniref:caM kinase-like vesicle-associated, like n=1 Tax=Synchiropus splendidus TaxID=270530 RepID=UPI00237E9780|nr:caM kinase-like vesicle-associated, like [Synchiropus splendidus]XP_053704338.1 caM kinase-like vesicle-associated, like [Synchiropus splendidus]XP_053704339.1 caM kinase-like vesicle-associated, like [Synchiropus splendidus]
MPFGCLALRDGRTYDAFSDITDKYEIGQVLRAKEFCELCLVKERQTEKVFVCKKFLKKDGRKVRKAAKNEIMILKLVTHPNILQLIDTFETRKEYFIIQEFATGGDVFDWIQDQGNYTEKDASNVIRQVLEAVAYLHSLNIVHRNLKLENLMYYTENNHNKVVLRDFYLSRFENGPITEPCGTPEYLAPEVVARHRYGRPVDCWAVGVIMYILLSGNPPFYDETEEENTDLHNRIIFCRIVAGDFEFDSPYWDDISPAAKELVCRLMEVDQMLRITAQDALWHEWIAGNGASEKNLKDGVCAQFEKNFAKAKWRKAIRVTTFMQRLKNSEALTDSSAEAHGTKEAGEGEGRGEEGVTSSSVSLEVTVENTPPSMELGEDKSKVDRVVPPDVSEPACHPEASPQEEPEVKRSSEGARKGPASLPPNKVAPEQSSGTAAALQPSGVSAPKASPDKRPQAPKVESDGSWCQTQLPEAVAEASAVGPVSPALSTGVQLRGDCSPGARRDRDARRTDRHSAEFAVTRVAPPVGQACYAAGSSASLGRHVTPYRSDLAGSYGSPYSTLYSRGGLGMYGTGLHPPSGDWQMDSVIEQIEKQMAAVLEKIEGDMPSLLEQISDCPPELPRLRSANVSPATSRSRTSQQQPPPPLPTSPRPGMPSLPRLTIPPPTYPPPSPPTQAAALGEREERDGQRRAARSSQSPRAGMGRGL